MVQSGKDAGPQQSESQIQRSILEYLKSVKECWAVKVMMANSRGCPDILVCYQGRFIGIEVKGKKGRLSSPQIFQAAQIKKAGGVSIVARSLDDVKEVVK